MGSEPNIRPRETSNIRARGGCSTVRPVAPTRQQPARERVSREAVKKTMANAPRLAPRNISQNRATGACSTAQAAPVQAFR